MNHTSGHTTLKQHLFSSDMTLKLLQGIGWNLKDCWWIVQYCESIPPGTWRWINVVSMLVTLDQRCYNVEPTSCAQWDSDIKCWRAGTKNASTVLAFHTAHTRTHLYCCKDAHARRQACRNTMNALPSIDHTCQQISLHWQASKHQQVNSAASFKRSLTLPVVIRQLLLVVF